MPDGIIDFKPPVKGIDESLPARAQADLTCPDAMNARSFPSSSNVLTIGKRDGFDKAFSNPAGGGSGQPGTGLTTALRASSTSPSTAGSYKPVVERWSGYQIDQPYSGYLNGYNFRGKYARFSRKLTNYGSSGWQGSTSPPSENISLVRSGSSFTITHASALSTFVAGYGIGLASAYATSNDMAITQYCYRRALSSADFVDCHNIGPFVRGHADLGAFVWAYLRRTAANTVKLVISYVAGATETDLITSDDITLSGSATISNNCTIRLVATASGAEATLTWPDELTEPVRVSAASTVGVNTCVMDYDTLVGAFKAGDTVTQATGATGIVLEDSADSGTNKGYMVVWVLSGTFNGVNNLSASPSGATARARSAVTTSNARAGWFFKDPGTSYPVSEPGYFRRVSGMDFSELVPPEPEVIAAVEGTDQRAGADRYYVPPNWMAVDIDYTQGSPMNRLIGGTTGYSTSSAPRAPTVDTTNDYILGPITDRTARTGFMTIEVWNTSPPTEHLPVEFKLRDIDATEEDTGGAVFGIENLTL